MTQTTSSVDDVDNRNVVKHDPNGLVRRDLLLLHKAFPRKQYKPTMTHGEIMYQEGMQRVLEYIEDKLIARQ